MNDDTVGCEPTWPTVTEVAQVLENINKQVDDECDVRLQVYQDGTWAVRYGASDYDQDHRGYWGASSVPGFLEASDFDSLYIAADLIGQCQESYFDYQAYLDAEHPIEGKG